MNCRICGKTASTGDYCVLHGEAHQNVMKMFEAWKRALDISWETYLKQIIENLATGIKAKEVAEDLLSQQAAFSVQERLSV